MPNKKLLRIKKEHIKEVPEKDNAYILAAFIAGYIFIKEKDSQYVYMISSTVSKKQIKIQLIENIEIVE